MPGAERRAVAEHLHLALVDDVVARVARRRAVLAEDVALPRGARPARERDPSLEDLAVGALRRAAAGRVGPLSSARLAVRADRRVRREPLRGAADAARRDAVVPRDVEQFELLRPRQLGDEAAERVGRERRREAREAQRPEVRAARRDGLEVFARRARARREVEGEEPAPRAASEERDRDRVDAAALELEAREPRRGDRGDGRGVAGPAPRGGEEALRG